MDWTIFWTILAQVAICFIPFLFMLYMTVSAFTHARRGPRAGSHTIYTTPNYEGDE